MSKKIFDNSECKNKAFIRWPYRQIKVLDFNSYSSLKFQ